MASLMNKINEENDNIIFGEYNIEELKDDNNFDKLMEVLVKFTLKYENFVKNFHILKSKENLKSFCNDSQKLFSIINHSLNESLNCDNEDEDEDEDEDTCKQIENTIKNIEIFLTSLPKNEFIDSHSLEESEDKLNNEKTKIALFEINSFFKKIGDDMTELNESMKEMNTGLEKSCNELKATVEISIISKELKEKYLSLNDNLKNKNFSFIKEDIKWATEKMKLINEIINDNNYDLKKELDYAKYQEISEKHKTGMTVTKEESKSLTEYNTIETFKELIKFLNNLKLIIEKILI